MGSSAHSIVLRTEDFKQLAETQVQVQMLLDHPATKMLAILRWDELIPGLKQAIELDMAGGWLFYFSLVLIVTFSILNTFLMSILERTREFATMLALGCRPWGIVRLVLTECALLLLIGLTLGIIAGSAVVAYFGIYGFSVPGSEEVMKIWNLPGAVYTRLSPRSLSSGPGIIALATLIAVIYPTLRIFKLSPTEASQGR